MNMARTNSTVIPAKAGIQCRPTLDSRFRGNDGAMGLSWRSCGRDEWSNLS